MRGPQAWIHSFPPNVPCKSLTLARKRFLNCYLAITKPFLSMKTSKQCPSCGTRFDGRSNQLYCSNRCKMAAFQAHKTQTAEAPGPTAPIAAMPPPVLPTRSGFNPRPSPADSTRPESAATKESVALRRLELKHAQRLRELEMEEVALRHAHELTMARLPLAPVVSSGRGEPRPKPVRDTPPLPLSPLGEWSHFPLGFRRRYQALVKAFFEAAEAPMSPPACREWLAAYGPFQGAIEGLLAQQPVVLRATKPFIWLGDLAEQIDAHRKRGEWADTESALLVRIEPTLRQQLVQACL